MHQKPRDILYVDDDAGMRRLVEKLLGRRGHHVTTAASGQEGVELVRSKTFELVAVDHYMPGMDGLETLKAIKALPGSPPVVYVTGSEESSVAVAALKNGASEYVVKSAANDFVDLLEQAFTHALATVGLERAKSQAEEALKESNERLHTLLREVNHRVANSLQLVSTMVQMQSRTLADPAATDALMDTERRIQAIAQVHRRLYSGTKVESVAMDEYLAALVAELEETWSTPGAPRSIVLHAEPLLIHPDKAVSLGVIVNELVSNACKYAYPETEAGEIRVGFRRADDRHFQLLVEDDGRGLTAGVAPGGTGLGSKLIAAMAKALSSELDYDPGHSGVRATLRAAF